MDCVKTAIDDDTDEETLVSDLIEYAELDGYALDAD